MQGLVTQLVNDGNELVVTGGDAMPYQAVLHTPGQVWQLHADLLKAELTRDGPVPRPLLGRPGVAGSITQCAQSSIASA
jgi:hypothetical protein